MAVITLDAPAKPRLGAILSVILLGQFMAVLDVSVVNVAAPTIRTGLNASGAGLQLVIAGYTIAYAMLLITGARLGDLLSHRTAFLAGLAVFTAASLACGLAGSTGLLIAFRLVQGAGAALMVPQVMSLIQRNFEGASRARALGVYSAVLSGGAVVGQVVGGLLVTADLFGTGWRPVFLVNVPIGVVLLIAGRRVLPGDRGEARRGFDVPGLVTLSASVLLFVVPLVLGHEEDWPVWGWIMLAASVVVFAIFAVVERRAASPLIRHQVLRVRGLVPAGVATFVLMSTFAGMLFAVALHLQGHLGYSPLRAGLSFVPSAGAFALVSMNWRRAPARLHDTLIPAGLLVSAVGFVLLAARPDDLWTREIALTVIGLGMGAGISPLLNAALRHVPVTDAGDASGLVVTLNQLGQVVGVAAFGTVYLSLTGAHALVVTALALAGTSVLAAGSSLAIRR